MKKKVLITGGAGFIGSHLADKLVRLGKEVFVIDNLSTGSLSNIEDLTKSKNFHYLIDDVLNKTILEKLIKKVDTVIHLAAAVGVKYVIDNPLLSLETNIIGTDNVLSIANKHKKLVFLASTSEIYGKNEKSSLKEDDDRILGSTHISRWGYSASKAIDEFIALGYFREKKLPIIIGRFFNTVGPRQSERYGMVIPRFVKQALLNHPITVYGSGKQTRCFNYISDTVDAIIGLINCPKAIGETFNIGNTKEISIKDLAKKIKSMAGSSSKIICLPYEKAYEKGFEDMQRRVPGLAKIKRFIGYTPKVNLEQLLTKTIKSFEK